MSANDEGFYFANKQPKEVITMYFSTGDVATLFIIIFLLVAGFCYQMATVERLTEENAKIKNILNGNVQK
ncbi:MULTISPECIES: hypothetical protein [Aerococcus]|uniref:Uncharacterized protein n=1 Tax=Aerococcus tenax TaxID=3078812 RepID=A0A5N1BWL2_9LACT|nr:MULTISPECIES: hypothetical protein [Aerococcus]KAA9242802.1 hypothetical protein F6I34_01150 [Aerococcus urinae]KAA9293733.1 hypothetical protein F6I06_00975 [Aerococcus mictus]MCY3066415.1 hypothetical protein [Aerococcus mictus]MCY3075819.1 hypothetical protein [Aerococcus mictus]MCY3083405.1 hypothetical protein [Aerococcus mictus]